MTALFHWGMEGVTSSVVELGIQGEPVTTYKEKQTRDLSVEKMANMITTYDRFIAPNR